MATNNFWSTLGNFAKSDAGKQTIAGIGGAIENYQDNQLKNNQLKQNAASERANLLQRDYEFGQGQQLQRAQSVKDSPYQQLQLAQRQALMSAILPNLRNYETSYKPSAGPMGTAKVSGGFKLPDQGFGEDVLRQYSPQATQSVLGSIAKNNVNIDPSVSNVDLTALYGDSANGTMADLWDYQQNAQDAQASSQATHNQALMNAIDQAKAEEQKKNNPWWKKVLKVASIAAPIVAAPFTGGTSLALLAAGSGALGGALDGGLKGAILGGSMGALGGGALGKLGSTVGGKVATSAASNFLAPTVAKKSNPYEVRF